MVGGRRVVPACVLHPHAGCFVFAQGAYKDTCTCQLQLQNTGAENAELWGIRN